MRKSLRSAPRPSIAAGDARQEYYKRIHHVPKLAALASQPPRQQELSKWLTDFSLSRPPHFSVRRSSSGRYRQAKNGRCKVPASNLCHPS